MEYKKCSNCKELKEYKEFSKDKKTKTGLDTYCRVCKSNKNKNRVLSKKSLANYKKWRNKYYKKNRSRLITQTNAANKKRDSGLLLIYWSMKIRCTYKSQYNYRWYGGKGIKVEWEKYVDFRKDMYESYIDHLNKFGKKETTIDRIDSDKNYCKENCRWATLAEQKINQFSKKRMNKSLK